VLPLWTIWLSQVEEAVVHLAVVEVAQEVTVLELDYLLLPELITQ
jgi:hypothetical protein